MLLIVEKSIRCGIGHAIHWYVIDNDIKLSLTVGMEIIFMDGQYHKRCLQVVLSGLKMHLNLLKILWKATMKKVMKGASLKLILNILKVAWP